MTSRDLWPIGKYKGQPISTIPQDYRDWFCGQDWAASKYPDLYEFLMSEDGVADRPVTEEQKVIDAEQELLAHAPTAFTIWWKNAYGERLRKQGEVLYVPYLRVALEAWKASHHASVEEWRSDTDSPPENYTSLDDDPRS